MVPSYYGYINNHSISVAHIGIEHTYVPIMVKVDASNVSSLFDLWFVNRVW